jgi:hypothetical protein
MTTTAAPVSKASAKSRVPCINAPVEVEAAPGERCVWLRDEQIPRRVGVFTWQRLGDGTYAPLVRVYDTLVRLSDVKKHGILIPWDTLRRLTTGGFVKYTQPAPGSIFICMDSLIEHLTAAEDPEFWTPERLRRYSAAIR